MSDPTERDTTLHLERHRAGRPSDGETDPDRSSDVGGPAAGMETTVENGLDADSGVGDAETDSPARNPL